MDIKTIASGSARYFRRLALAILGADPIPLRPQADAGAPASMNALDSLPSPAESRITESPVKTRRKRRNSLTYLIRHYGAATPTSWGPSRRRRFFRQAHPVSPATDTLVPRHTPREPLR
jgi:hypothetical protein